MNDGSVDECAALRIELDGTVLRITFEREQQRNAITPSMAAAIRAAVDCAVRDEQCSCILLRGAGTAFSSGSDLAYVAAARERPPLERYLTPDPVVDLLSYIAALPIPTIAAVTGAAAGGGVGLAAACAFVIADAGSASFTLPEASFGVFPFPVLSQLATRVAPSRAAMWALTCERVSAQDAYAAGLVDRLLPTEGFDEAVDAFVHSIATRPRAMALAAARWRRLQLDEALRGADHAKALGYLFASAQRVEDVS